jgi:large subunit ribosomal protein L6
MSRIGKEPIVLPKGVEVTFVEGNFVTVKGPKGSLTKQFHPNITLEKVNDKVLVKRPDDVKQNRALHGLTRALIQNMVQGVVQGYQKNLEIVGVGYKAEKKGKNLLFILGYSHPIVLIPPEGIQLDVKGNVDISVSGIDKELVGLTAAKIRSFKKPEPYKGKGIRYKGEFVPRKAGKYAK